MAIKTLNYTVLTDGVTPNYERRAGVQYDHNKTELQFTLDSTLYNTLFEKLTDGSLYYRFDVVDGEGRLHLGEARSLESITLEPFLLNYWHTKFGGKIKVCLIITSSNAGITTTEFSSDVALSLDDLPQTVTNEKAYKSLTTLTEQSAEYAQTVAEIKDDIVTLHGELSEIEAMLQNGEWVFDGNTDIDVNFVVDSELDSNSKNAVSNSVVTKKLNEVENKVDGIIDGIGQSVYDSLIGELRLELMLSAHPIGSYYWSSESINPQDLFGGVWEQVKDIFLLAAGDDYAAGSSGGEANHKLIKSEMPEHGHRFKSDYSSDGIEFVVPTKTTGSGTSCITREGSASRPGHWANQTWGTNAVGGNQAHNNMPPYIAAYCFKRIG